MNKVRKQHYVPRMYLRGWATDNQIYCLRNKKIFISALENVAQRRDYYRLEIITEEGLALIHAMIENTPDTLKVQFKEIIELLRAIPISFGIIKSIASNDNAKEISDIAINDTIEKLLSGIERNAAPFMCELRSGNAEFWNNENLFLDFLLFIAFQFVRTPKQENKAKQAMGEMYESCWGIISILLALILVARINESYENWTLSLLINQTDLPFITNDNPAINLSKVASEEVLDFDLYMPISPQYAIRLNKSNKKSKVEYLTLLKRSEVDEYNHHIMASSLDMLFADNPSTLEYYI